MDIDAITKLIQAVKASDISVLEASDGDVRVRIERAPQASFAAPLPAPAKDARREDEDASSAVEDYKRISSPLVGIFRPQPEDKGVKAGARIQKGTIVCFVEAMKLMNEIAMPEDGELVWIAASDGDAVEYGQTLFHYR